WAALRLVDGRSPAEPGPRFAWADWNEQRTELTITFSGVNGRLQKVERVFSFQLTNGEERLPLEGHLDEAAERVILTLERPAPDSCQLWHGRGTNPAVNVRDEKGIPLLVF
ncbi:hypothetical protein K0U00_50380, partial [Paenibacillus sepulcri]|nr:hypothetical protein [Paenibacillus sepulcri]